MKNILLAVTLLSALLVSTVSQATLLSIELNATDYQVGDVLSADLIISDIETEIGFQKLLASFAFDISFDSSMIEFASISFGDKLDVDPTFSSFQYTDELAPGLLNLSEESFAFYDDLFSAQDGLSQFVLASINFTVMSAGSDVFSLNNVAFGDDLGDAFTSISSSGQAYNVTPSVNVPEPSSILLMAFAALLLMRHQRYN